MLAMFALGSDLPEIEVIRSALREAEVHDHFHCCLRFYKHSGMLVNWPQVKLTTIFFMQYSAYSK